LLECSYAVHASHHVNEPRDKQIHWRVTILASMANTYTQSFHKFRFIIVIIYRVSLSVLM
jgi:hypothetical protein